MEWKRMGYSVTTSSKAVLPPGSLITGKWKKGRYRVERLLGQGANGIVYLVRREWGRERYALKIGYDAVDLQSEINVLQSLLGKRQQGSRGLRSPEFAHPFLVEVDDFPAQGRDIPFYVMRYVQGSTLQQFIDKNGPEWFGLIGYRLLGKLAALHDMGFAFGDLKAENILVSDYGRVELVDYGGVSAIGRSVKQFTESYDRGFWNAGTRTADPGYDLFSYTALWLHVLDRTRLRRMMAEQLPITRQASDLMQLIRTNAHLKPFERWFGKAASGQFATSREACAAWKETMLALGGQSGELQRNRAKSPYWLTGALIAAVLLLCSTIYWVLQS